MREFDRRGALAAAILAAGLLLQAGAASAAGLLNSDFENGPPSIGGPGPTDYYRGVPTDWQQLAGYDNVDIIENGYSQGPPVLLTAQSGTHFLDMNGAGSSGGIYQDIAGVAAGSQLTLSFYTGQWATNSSGESVTASLIDATTLVVLGTLVVSDIDGTGWTKRSFTASGPTSGNLRVQLIGNTGFQAGPGLDNVVLSVNGAGGVPEPASWALLIAGFAGVGGVIRGQRRRTAVAV